MTSPIQCPSCQQQYPYNAALAGRQVRCKRCGGVFLVPPPAPAALPAGLSDFLSEELDAPHPASRSSAPVEEETRPRPRPSFSESAARPSRKERKRNRDVRKTSMFTTMGLVMIVMPHIQAAARHEPLVKGPYTAGFVIITSLVGLVLIVLGWFRR